MVDNIYWEIPSSIDLEGFLKKHPPEFKYKIDHFYSIIDYICKGMERENLDDNKGFVNLNAQKLQKANHNYKQYLTFLQRYSFLRTDKKYIVGKKSFGYMLNGYTTYKSIPKQIPISDNVIKKNKVKEVKEFQNELKQEAKNHPYLAKWFNEKLQIDIEGAQQKIEELFPEQTGGIRGVRKGKASRWSKRYKAIQAIQKIAKQDFYHGVDDNVGRFHSNLTNIKRELRNYITYDSKKLVNVDIKNSQPLFSTLLLKKEFWTENQGELLSFYHFPSLFTNLSKLNTNHYYIIMLVKALEKSNNQLLSEYIEYVNSGEFYKKISYKLYPSRTFDKQAIKEMFYKLFFSKNRVIQGYNAKPKRDFRTHFPKIYEIFSIVKRKDYKTLAQLLQRIESNVMIKNVAKRISEEKPDLPIFTIHDSIATTIGNEDYVSSVIMEEVLRLTSLKVKLGKEYWG
jgi:hypothetical protein